MSTEYGSQDRDGGQTPAGAQDTGRPQFPYGAHLATATAQSRRHRPLLLRHRGLDTAAGLAARASTPRRLAGLTAR